MNSFLRCFYALIAIISTVAANALNVSPGVSRELASLRKANYNDIVYTLHFDVPSLRSADITGKVNIEFNHIKNTPAIIDFRADKNQILSLKVNGKPCDYTFKDEHIIIDAKHLKKGREQVTIDFISGSKPLNRNDEFVYTLLVPDRARTLFPCFDQPDLKATYKLSLNVPADWIALSNTSIAEESVNGDTRYVQFADTEPLSTYLFSFVAGKFTKESRTQNGRTISAYYRETDPDKIAQLDNIFNQVFAALDWQEDFTAIKYPFAKYDFVILPGFQFGGMEHTGATLYNDRMMFLGNHPTPEEELSRAQLIAHETSHMWYGDLVTMVWFDDVWTKEVFANYFAAVITEPSFKNLNHILNRINTFYIPSLNEDRTPGRTAIQQPLDNLQDAGLIYGNIIYDKAPVVMFKIVDLMGEEAYKEGLRKYLKKYSYDNATWDDLIAILDAETPEDIEGFSDVWIKSVGMPHISFTPTDDGFDIEQTDPYDRGLVWQQSFSVRALNADSVKDITVDLNSDFLHYELGFKPDALIPNSDGRGYAYFIPDDKSLDYILNNWYDFDDEAMRMASMLTLYENYHNHRYASPDVVINSFLKGLEKEQNPLIAAATINALEFMCTHTEGNLRLSTELAMDNLASIMPTESARLKMQRIVCRLMTEPSIVNRYFNMWSDASNPLWSESDYTTASYELAVRMPEKADSILSIQRSRITNADRLKQFDFISPACSSDKTLLDSLFNSLQLLENRLIEPYAESRLYYLNHPTRDIYSSRYIIPGLELLAEVQRTGDIFFPIKWTQMLLGSHRSNEAREALNKFLDSHPDYPILLKNKILQSAYPLTFTY
jgi:aminopeptidase N